MTISFRRPGSLLCIHIDWDQLCLKFPTVCLNSTLHFMIKAMLKITCIIYEVENYWINPELTEKNMSFTLCDIKGFAYGIPYLHTRKCQIPLRNLSLTLQVGMGQNAPVGTVCHVNCPKYNVLYMVHLCVMVKHTWVCVRLLHKSCLWHQLFIIPHLLFLPLYTYIYICTCSFHPRPCHHCPHQCRLKVFDYFFGVFF